MLALTNCKLKREVFLWSFCRLLFRSASFVLFVRVCGLVGFLDGLLIRFLLVFLYFLDKGV